MEKDDEETKVIFKKARYYKSGGEPYEEVLAFFPGAPACRGNVMCYAHCGQHGEAAYDFYRDSCSPCGMDAYAPLKMELERLGYRLKVVRRITRKDMDEAWRPR